MKLFDSHCHLTDMRFQDDREQVLERARAGGVEGMVTVASDYLDSLEVARLAAGAEYLWCTAGIHPHEAGAADLEHLQGIRDLVSERSAIVAIGETGLDYHYDHSPREVQRQWFGRQLELAAELGLPVVVHSREADEDTAALLREHSAVSAVLHCFSGGRRLLEEGLELGCYVSFAGITSFKRFDDADAVRAVPVDRLLIETDAPYLAPVPHRGKRNEPAFVAFVCAAVAAHRGEEPARVAGQTFQNAIRFYGLEP